MSLPGIADVTAAWLLAEGVSATAFSTASQLVGYSGLAIKEEISGTSVRGKASIDRLGNAQLRKCFYMPALVAMRVRARGKPSKVIIVAVMRKLLRLIYDGTLLVWDVESGQRLRMIEGYAASLFDLDWSPDGRFLASGGADTLVTLWDGASATAPRVLRGHRWIVQGVAWIRMDASWPAEGMTASECGTRPRACV